NRLIRCVCGKKIGPDPRNFNQRVSLGRNDLLIRTFPNELINKDVEVKEVMEKTGISRATYFRLKRKTVTNNINLSNNK
ncbi:MerR family transcriptional regulator, partial [Escherichia coli]